jgi:AcrR family transcriptional regulator
MMEQARADRPRAATAPPTDQPGGVAAPADGPGAAAAAGRADAVLADRPEAAPADGLGAGGAEAVLADQPDAAPAAGPGEALPGRRGQARRNDALILEAAREVFLNDPKAPVAAVAEHAGVGISALYRRYPSKEDLLRRLCHDGLRRFIAEAEAAGTDPDTWSALTGFLERIVEADVHSLTVHLAGTFTPTPQMHDDAQRAGALAAGLAERAQAAGRLRPDVVADDLGLVLEGCAAIRVLDPVRTGELRRRYLRLLLDGLAAIPTAPGGTGATGPGASPLGEVSARPPLPGPPPHGEQNWRWRQR